MLQRPIILAVSGIDGSGKTTQSRLLAEYLHGRGLHVEYTHANRKLFRQDVKGGDGRAHTRRRRALVWVLLVACKDVLKMWMFIWHDRHCDVLVSDRYRDDVIVKLRYYHPPIQRLDRFVRWATPAPLRTIWLDVRPETSFQRDQEYPSVYHEQKGALYQQWFTEHAQDVVRINGERSPSDVHQEICDKITPLLTYPQ